MQCNAMHINAPPIASIKPKATSATLSSKSSASCIVVPTSLFTMWKPGSDKPSRATAPKKAASAKVTAPVAAAAAPASSEARPTSKAALSQKTLAMKVRLVL